MPEGGVKRKRSPDQGDDTAAARGDVSEPVAKKPHPAQLTILEADPARNKAETVLSPSPQPLSTHDNRPVNNTTSNSGNKGGKPSGGPSQVRAGRQQQPGRQPNLYGNYRGYHSYRVERGVEDPRVPLIPFSQFNDKVCLDIGCSSGDFTLKIAECGKVKSMVGVDIDSSLVDQARRNVDRARERVVALSEQAKLDKMKRETISEADEKEIFPISLRITLGPLHPPGSVGETGEAKETPVKGKGKGGRKRKRGADTKDSSQDGEEGAAKTDNELIPSFPENVHFYAQNYAIGQSDPFGPYDVITCFSVVKWIHINWGDAGLKQVFRKIYSALSPGGIFILEAQPWKSYRRQYCVTSTMQANLKSIKIRPAKFPELLTSDEIGFKAFEHLGRPTTGVPGFRRPIWLFRK